MNNCLVSSSTASAVETVIAGPDAAVHYVLGLGASWVDARVEPGHDDRWAVD